MTVAVLFIEFQREWLDPESGKLGGLMQDRAQFDDSQRGAADLLIRARRAGSKVVHVPCLFDRGYPEIGGGKAAGLFAAIPKAGTWTEEGRSFAVGFEPLPGEFIVSGRVGASAFSSSNLDAFLRNNAVTEVQLAGYALHVCVESTLRHGHDLGYTMTIVDEACAAFTNTQRQYVLNDVVQHFGRSATIDQLYPDIDGR